MLKGIKNYLFDIDGTLAIDSTLYKGTRELLSYIESIGGHTFYITNNSTKSQKDYIEKFRQWGIKAVKNQFITASYATCLYLKEHFEGKKLFVLGTASFIEEIKSFGLNVTEEADKDAACVVVGFDDSLTYDKVLKACKLLFDKNVSYIGTNPDYRCPTKFGFIPDCGGICEMLNCTVNRKPVYIGKPNPLIVDLCLKESGGRKEETIIVGDRLYTDIACGINAGVKTAVVLTGEAAKNDLDSTEYKPDYCFDTIYDFYLAASGIKKDRE